MLPLFEKNKHGDIDHFAMQWNCENTRLICKEGRGREPEAYAEAENNGQAA